jgi:predicted enzyme related to lactoylglutathione lyase
MTVRLVALALDTQDPERVARFWSHALGWTATSTGNGDVEVTPTDVTTFTIVVRLGGAAKTGQNRVHFDLTTSSENDQDATVTDLLALGGAHVDIGQSPEEDHVVLADPDGNELCVIAPGNNFLAGCPRLGAVNCDGTSALGHFWSEALGWPLVWDQDEETAIQAPDGTGPKITWSGPPLMSRTGPERIHFHLSPQPDVTADDAAGHLLALGAHRARHRANCPGTVAFIDVDGNPFCLITP